jgi:hypothetical protein
MSQKLSLQNAFIGFMLVVGVALLLFAGATGAKANEPNLSAKVASSSAIQVGPQQNKTLFSDTATGSITSLCAARIISTAGSAIMLSFDSNMTPSASVGITQAASTTVSYPADVYGCGPVTAYGYSSTTVSKIETRW